MRIFISYRREDSEWIALSLYNQLTKHFKEGEVFKDVNTIRPGDDFTRVIESSLKGCDVLLVVIGKEWLSCADPAGKQRLFANIDFVRFEIETAIRLGKKVVPVLVDDVEMPTPQELPPTIADVHKMQAVRVSSTNFDLDVFHLANSLYEITGSTNQYSNLVKGIATGKVSEKELVKPESNSAYAILCAALGGLILLYSLSEANASIAIVGFAILVAGGYAYLLSRKVRSLWLSQGFDDARRAAKRARLISLMAPGAGMVVIVIIALIQVVGVMATPEFRDMHQRVEELVSKAQPAPNAPAPEIPSGNDPVRAGGARAALASVPETDDGSISVRSSHYGELLERFDCKADVFLSIGDARYQLMGADIPIQFVRPGMVDYRLTGSALCGGQLCTNDTGGQVMLTKDARYYLYQEDNDDETDCGWYLYAEREFVLRQAAVESELRNAAR